jgi:hypothetical protein
MWILMTMFRFKGGINTMRIFIDIETAPTDNPDIIKEIEQGVTPPGNISKAETIEAWNRDKRPTAVAEAVSRTALDAGLGGTIIAIGIATDDHAPIVLDREPSGDSDADLLREAFRQIDALLLQAAPTSPTDGERLYKPDPYFIGHNVSFDLGFIWRRAVMTGVRIPFEFPTPSDIRHGKNAFCTMQAWAGYGNRISLSKLARALHIPDPKAGEINGANAWQHWREGNLDAVRDYCAADVMTARRIFFLMLGVNGRAA